MMVRPEAILAVLALALHLSAASATSLSDVVVRVLEQTSNPGQLAELVPVLSVDFAFKASDALVQAVVRAQEGLAWQVKVHVPDTDSSYDLRHGVADVWIANPEDIGDIMGRWDSGRLAMITPSALKLSSPQHINSQWYATDSALRLLANYDTYSIGIPISGSLSVALYYRTDLPPHLGLQPDRLVTWRGLLQLVADLNNTLQHSHSQLPQYALCWHRGDECGGTLLMSMVAPIIQSNGTEAGLMIDVFTGALLVNTSAAQLAITIFQRLHSYSLKHEDEICEPYNELFLSGRCAINLASATAFKYYSQHPNSTVRGRFAVAPMPGSDVVLDRSTLQLVPCNKNTCPQAVVTNSGFQTSPLTAVSIQTSSKHSKVSMAQLNTTSIGSNLNWLQGDELLSATPLVSFAPFNYSQLGSFPVLSGPFVNQAPFMSDAMMAVVSKDLPSHGLKQAIQLLENLTSEDASWPLLLDMNSGVTPFLYAHIDADDLQMGVPQQWSDAGYDPIATQSYVDTIRWAMKWAPNAAHNLRILGSDEERALQARAAQQACQGLPPSLITQELQGLILQLYSQLYTDMDDFLNEYRLSVAVRGLLTTKVPIPPVPVSDSSSSNNGRTVAITVSVLVGAALGIALLLRTWFARRRHKDTWGCVLPPPKHPDTTLLVAALKGLTELHASCSSDVVGRAMAVWQTTTDQLLRHHSGYKLPSSTIGTLHAAFHTPCDAAIFALQLHQRLLDARWPRQVMDVPMFAPMYMEPRDGEGTVHAGTAFHIGSDMAPGPLSMPPTSPHPPNTVPTPMPLSADYIQGQTQALHEHGGALTGDAVLQGDENAVTRGRLASCDDGPAVLTFGAQCVASWLPARIRPMFPAPTSLKDDTAGETLGMAGVLLSSATAGSTGAALKPPQLYSQVSGHHVGVVLPQEGQAGMMNADMSEPPWTTGVKVSAGLQACISLCAVCGSEVTSCKDPTTGRTMFDGPPLVMAQYLAACGQAGMTLIPQQTFRQLSVEVMSETTLFCHYGEYQLAPELPAMDIYLALSKALLARLALFAPLTPDPQGYQLSPGVLAAPVARAAMVFTHVVGVQALLAWNYDLTHCALEVFTRLAQQELRTHNGYLVEHVSGFMLSAFQQPAAAVLWALRLQELMLREPWSEELLSHELCEEVIVQTRTAAATTRSRAHSSALSTSDLSALPTYEPPTRLLSTVQKTCQLSHPQDSLTALPTAESVPVRGTVLFRGPRLKTGIDVGPILTALNTVTGRMAYRGKVMNRAARIAGMAASGQVLCSAEALIAAHGVAGINCVGEQLAPAVIAAAASPISRHHRRSSVISLGSQAPSSAALAGLMATTSIVLPAAHSADLPIKGNSTSTFTTVQPASVSNLLFDASAARASVTVSSTSQTVHPMIQEALLPVNVKSLGLFQLKGIVERIEVFHCFYVHPHIKVRARRPSMHASRAASRRTSAMVFSKPSPLTAMQDGWSTHASNRDDSTTFPVVRDSAPQNPGPSHLFADAASTRSSYQPPSTFLPTPAAMFQATHPAGAHGLLHGTMSTHASSHGVLDQQISGTHASSLDAPNVCPHSPHAGEGAHGAILDGPACDQVVYTCETPACQSLALDRPAGEVVAPACAAAELDRNSCRQVDIQ